MVKHIVVYTLKEGVDKEKAVEVIRSVLEPLVGVIPGAGSAIRTVKTPAGVLVILAIAFFLLELSYRKEKQKDDADLDSIKDEIRRLKAEQEAKMNPPEAEAPEAE